MPAPPPVVKAFLICDYVIHEAETNKKSCVGIFHQISAERFPCRHGQLSIYANLIDGAGSYAFKLTLVHLQDGKEIGSGGAPPVRIPDRLQTAELAFRLENIIFPEPGKYEFNLFANDQLVARKEISVVRITPQSE